MADTPLHRSCSHISCPYSIEERQLRRVAECVRRPSYHEDVAIRHGRDGLSIRVDDIVADAEFGEVVEQIYGVTLARDSGARKKEDGEAGL